MSTEFWEVHWLLADKDAVNSFLSRPAHIYSGAITVGRPDNEKNPKSRMMGTLKLQEVASMMTRCMRLASSSKSV
ncbi:hypothetical protein [Methylotenera versatilis]|uniref:hypothetical protein n=1 Tax=Methylotenera versatilis TaxID=1055487 RepID=UPI0006485AE6|nr:hypothetical protein [Methylotenera versatilis]